MRTVEWKMRNGTMASHCIYTVEEADRINLKYMKEWRKGGTGDWVLTDDNHVVRILKKSNGKNASVMIRTCTMSTNPVSPKSVLDVKHRDNRYSLNGKRGNTVFRMSTKIRLMCELIISGIQPEVAFTRSHYGTTIMPTGRKGSYVKERVRFIMGQLEVKEIIKTGLAGKLEKAGITVEWLLGQYKRLVEYGENESAKVSAMNKLCQLHGLDSNAVKEPAPLPQIPQEILDRLAGHSPIAVIQEEDKELELERTQKISEAVIEKICKKGDNNEKTNSVGPDFSWCPPSGGECAST